MKNAISLVIATAFLALTVPWPFEASAEGHNAKLYDLADLRMPEGTGPHPLVAIVPGCSGFKWPFYDRARANLHELGFASARVDYVAARNLGGCSYKASVDHVADDILFVAESLSERNEIKADSVNVLAWSSGGGGALQILNKLDAHPDISIASIAAYSPQCLGVEPWTADIPVLMFLGTKDVIAPPSYCRKFTEIDPNVGKIAIEEYEEAFHGFDDSDLPTNSGTMRYNAIAAEQAWEKLVNFLVR